MFKIKPLETFNEWLIVIPVAINTRIELPQQMQYQPFGIVVSKVVESNEFKSYEFKPGDAVRFFERNIIDSNFASGDPFYNQKRLVLLSRRNVICRIPEIPHEIIDN